MSSTAWNALYGMDGAGQLLPGQTLVVMGTGGVSCWAAQVRSDPLSLSSFS